MMSGIRTSEQRLIELRKLRDRIDAEIRGESKRLAAIRRRRDRQFKIDRRIRAQAADREARDAEAIRLDELAPTDQVRAWAVAVGRPVGNRGRLPRQLRLDYINAQKEPDA